MLQILCLDEDVAGLDRLEEMLRALGHNPVAAGSVGEGLAALEQEMFDLVVARSGRFDAAAPMLIERLRAAGCRTPVLFVGRPGDSPERAASLAGIDVLAGPLDPERLRDAVDRALAAGGLAPVIQEKYPAEDDELPMIGEAECVRRVLEVAAAVAPSTATVLVQGESGTGKELLVRLIHRRSSRARRPLVAVNCAALPEGLIESTLFGHERGAFTGATGRHPGAFERADGGTLLLDEISELRLDLQAKLLRALQERQIERVGGTRPVPVDVRVIATTNRNLATEVRAGRFRSDLYYRLNVVNLRIPPLRKRREDIRSLVHFFVAGTARDLNIDAPPIAEATLAVLEAEDWPGNVRELKHASERAVLLNRQGPLEPADFLSTGDDLLGGSDRLPAGDDRDDLTFASPDFTPGDGRFDGRDFFAPGLSVVPPPSRATRSFAGAPESGDPDLSAILNLKRLEQQAIMRALRITGGHRTRAAGLLGISDRTLRNKLNTPGPTNRRMLPVERAADSSGAANPSGDGRRRAGRPARLVSANTLSGNTLG